MGKKQEKVAEIIINVDELRNDAKAVAKQRGSSVTKILAVNDIGSGEFGHAKERYLRVFGSMEVEPNLPWGIILVDRYYKICNIFGLEPDKYLADTKEEKEVPTVDNTDDLKAELQSMRESIRDIGKIATQSMMYLKRLCEIWDKQ